MKNYRGLLILIFCVIVGCQNVSAQELTIGDTLPDCMFGSVLRSPSPQVRLSDFRGKVLILDLWRTTCGHAVASFGHFDSLQKQFPEQLAILAVTTEKRAFIDRYLEQNDYAAKTKLPVITDDTVLAGKRFPFIYIPHVVVINEKGIIVGISTPEAVTQAVIREVINGKVPSLYLKREITDFDYSAHLLTVVEDNRTDGLAYSSTFGRRLPGIMSIQDTYSSGSLWIYSSYNASIPELYMKAFDVVLPPNRLVLEVKNKSRFSNGRTDDESWKDSNLWCYNLLLPKETPNPRLTAIRELNRFFGVAASIEERKMPCLLLVRKGSGERWRAKHPNPGDYYLDSAGVTLIHNTLLSAAIDGFDYASRLPVIDKTDTYGQLADMKIEGYPNQLSSFRKQLWKYDLDLIPSMETIDVLVIRDEKK